MDERDKKKAFYRAKLNALKREKRIDDPLVRYNEHDQPICRVCNYAMKSESQWPAHQASLKHHKEIENYKARAAALYRANGAKPEPAKELAKPKIEHQHELPNHELKPSSGLLNTRTSSVLPPDFFDNNAGKNQKKESLLADPISEGSKVDKLATDKTVETSFETRPSEKKVLNTKTAAVSESKQVRGALPEGFFDDKDADLLARGIKPVKPDVKDEYKEFEKLIQEDLQEVDNRLEEEEFESAEIIEEAESVEQMARRERVESLRRQRMELKAGRPAASSECIQVPCKEPTNVESSSDDKKVGNVDWRAKKQRL